MSRRHYEKRLRAEAEAETRRRIVEAAVALHGEVGPARTRVSEIARRAGVSRPTVYAHFPDDGALLAACSAAWDATHPGPDLSAWAEIADPGARTTRALEELYGYYAANAGMLSHAYRDRELVPALDALHREHTDPWMDAVVGALAAGTGLRGRRRTELEAVLGVLVDFPTWRRFEAAGLDPSRAAGLAARIAGSLRDRA